ncbi:Transmembrane protein 14A, partial [Galemys pyrenaicus]
DPSYIHSHTLRMLFGMSVWQQAVAASSDARPGSDPAASGKSQIGRSRWSCPPLSRAPQGASPGSAAPRAGAPGTRGPSLVLESRARSRQAQRILKSFQCCLVFSAFISGCASDFLPSVPSSQIASLPMDLIGFGYAALLTFGSILGYKRRGGVPSLIAGLFVGFLAGYGAYRVSNDKRDVKLSLFTAFFLATIMGVRFKRSKKIMPAGLVAGL